MNKLKGFTVIELIIGLVIAVILIAFATSPIRDLMLRMRMSDQANLFHLDLNFARQEAINRSYSVAVLPNENWTDGWIIFEDKNDNGLLDVGESQLRESAYTNQKITIADSGTAQPVVFTRFGNLKTPTQRIFNLSHEELATEKQVVMAASGTVSVHSHSTSNEI